MLKEVEVEWRDDAPPDDVVAFLEDAQARVEEFENARLDDPIAGFVPSDFRRVYQGLSTVAARSLAPGSQFLEWGSGVGVVACLAAMLDFDACGIEIAQPLVDEAEALAGDHGLPVEFVCGSYIPEGADMIAQPGEEFNWIESGADGYGELGLDVEDFDFIYVYPWPGEEEVVRELFDAYGSSGALLLTFNGVEDLRLHRHA